MEGVTDATKKVFGYFSNLLGPYVTSSGKEVSSIQNQVVSELALQAKTKAELAVNEMNQMVRIGHPMIRLAGLSGATAVILGAYGAHAFARKDGIPEEFKRVFETANKYHFLHSIALMGAPLCRRPLLTGSLLALGTLVFSGTCYYYALTQEPWIRKFTPYGGFLLIFGWLSMAL